MEHTHHRKVGDTMASQNMARSNFTIERGDLVREVSIRALPEGSKYALGLVLSTLEFPATGKQHVCVRWCDNGAAMWHPARRLKKIDADE